MDFFDIVTKKEHIIIYGAGWAGRIVYEFLKIHHIHISCFAVTTIHDIKVVDHVQVLSINQVLAKYQNAFIIISALSEKQTEMENYLIKKSYKNYFLLPEILIYEMRQEVLAYQAEHMQIQINRDKNQFLIGYLNPGYLDTNYAEQRLIIEKIAGVEYIALPKELNQISYKKMGYVDRISDCKMITDAAYVPKTIPEEVKIIHTFNMVCMIDKSWIASFETCLPRIAIKNSFEKEYYLKLADAITRDNCKGILALSQNAYEIHCHILQEYLEKSMAEKIIKKTRVLHPSQEILISKNDFYKKHNNSRVHFLFIGNAFFIKGGKQMIKILSKLKTIYDFRLTIISSMQINDNFTNSTINDKLEVQKLINENEWIEYYNNLPNDKVLEKCREASIGIFPSLADTYGYVVLEMQAAGCPVITTNIRALSEINDKQCGWICELPVDEYKMCTKENLSKITEQLEKELELNITEILEKPYMIKEKGKLAIKRIQQMHDPKIYSDTIWELIM